MPTYRRLVDREGGDYYSTPEWCTQALLQVEKFRGQVLEPACGDGAMSEVMKATGLRVYSSDLYDRGYGRSGLDFLLCYGKVDNIVTNPPYHLADDFVKHGLGIVRNKMALLLRLSFLEGQRRYHGIFRYMAPSRVWVFSERITFYPKGAEVKGSGTQAYAWFVWDKRAPKYTTTLNWIAPGARSL